MSDVSWIDGNGNWNTPTDWSDGAVPTSGDAVTLTVGNPEINSDVGTIASLLDEDSLTVEDGTLAVSGTVTLESGQLDLDTSGSGGSSLTVHGDLTNNGGNLDIGNDHITDPVSVTVAGMEGAGATDLIGGSTSGAGDASVLHVAGAAGFGQTGEVASNISLSGDAQVQFASGEITAIAADHSLLLGGADAAISNNGADANSALTGLTSVAGELRLEDGASVATGGASTTADTLTVGNHLTDTGTMIVDNISIAPGGTLEVGANAGLDSAGGVTFDGGVSGAATLQLDATPTNGSSFLSTLNAFGLHDSLYLSGMAYAAGATATFASGTLTVTSNGVTETFTPTSPGATTFEATNDSGGVLVTPVCFVSGAHVRTERGDVAVEDLAVGDLAVTASGAVRPIIWIGRRTIERPVSEQRPVRVLAGAFGEGLPARDLWLSHGHAVCVDALGEVLIPVGELVNGVTIVREEVSEITYWHIELESHDLLLAEGLPAESYLDTGNRAFFGRAHGRLATLEPDRSLADSCRPFVAEGPLIEAVRERLAARAASGIARLARRA
jgi:hypothetical protein